MGLKNYLNFIFLVFLLAGCKWSSVGDILSNPRSMLQADDASRDLNKPSADSLEFSLDEVIDTASVDLNINDGFKAVVKASVENDPEVVRAKQEYQANQSSVKTTKTQKDFQISGNLYGGVEDLTDEIVGVAGVLNASRLVFDGGQLDSQISAQEFRALASLSNYYAKLDNRIANVGKLWIELERYSALNDLIGSRLNVLRPLIGQLEKVAQAGVGDRSQVAAAQRTVSMISVIQADVVERFEQARLNFSNQFGQLPGSVRYDSQMISSAVPDSISRSQVLNAPGLRGAFFGYQSALANLRSIEAKDNFNVGFEAKLQRPFGNSDYSSDESLGLVVRRTLYDGNKLNAEIEQATAQVEGQLAILRATFKEGKRSVEAAQQTILSLDKAITLAKKNAANAKEEIEYLRKQLVIGQSTLDSVLNAEARLYEAESKEINLIAERQVAELLILGSLGELAEIFELR